MISGAKVQQPNEVFFRNKEKSSFQRKKSVFCYKGLIPTFLLTTTLLQISIIAVVLAVRTALQESSSHQAEEQHHSRRPQNPCRNTWLKLEKQCFRNQRLRFESRSKKCEEKRGKTCSINISCSFFVNKEHFLNKKFGDMRNVH